MKKHVNHFGNRTLCGLIREKEESKIDDYFSVEKDKRCLSCGENLKRRGYSIKALEAKFYKMPFILKPSVSTRFIEIIGEEENK